MSKTISVIIPSYNSTETIRYTLDAILSGQSRDIKEIIVVDSSDDPEFQNIIKIYGTHGVRFINAGVRVMPAKGRNIGAHHATGKILIFLDSDVIPVDDYFREILIALERGYRAGGGGITPPPFQKHHPVALAQYYLQLNEYLPTGRDRIKPFLPGCNLFCHEDIFHKCGGFPEIRAAEDVIFGINVSKITDLWFIPNARVSHIFRLSISYFLNNQILLGKYAAVYRKQVGAGIQLNRLISSIMIPAFACLKLFRILPRIIKSGFHHTVIFSIISPLFALGLLMWSYGFSKGISGNEHD